MGPNPPRPTEIYHPDISEPIAIQARGDASGAPFKNGKPPQTWSRESVRRIVFDGAHLTYIEGKNYEFEFSTNDHLIDFNFAKSPSVMRVNSDRETVWDFDPYMTSFAPIATQLYRRPHKLTAGGTDLNLIGLNFSDTYIEGLVADTLDGRGVSFVEMSCPDRWPQMDRIQSGLLSIFQAPHLFSRLTAEALINDAIMRALLRWSSLGSRLTAMRFTTDDMVVGRAIEFIHANLTESISLADIARAAERDTTILVHAFKLATGHTPYAYLLARRIQVAQHDLRTSSMSVSQIAKRYAFGSPSHFSTTFRKFTGVSPRAYREHFKR